MIQPLVFLTRKTKFLQCKYFVCQRISQGSLVTHPDPIHYASRPMQTYSYEDQTLSFTDNTHTHKRESWPKWSMVWFYVVMDWFLILHIPILIRLNPDLNSYVLGRMTKHFKCTRRSLFKHRWLFYICILSHLLV